MADPFRFPDAIHRTLARLATLPEVGDFYLAGGTAVAVHARHRVSRDLDFFSREPGVSLERVKRAVIRAYLETVVVGETDVALRMLVQGLPVAFVSYPYPPGSALGSFDGIALASPLDLAVMKLAALSRRGLRRDFWDLWVLVRGGIPLDAAGAAYCRRFGTREADLYHVMRALTYLDDAEREATPPEGMTSALWSEIRESFLREAPKLVTLS
ncbi:MAG: nucleotidyl transferase AbiEii/AbiGii toxin family protein [Deltaproteobacteria bacterium]|nr:nucleotidyl transferase AbiEii/AbiGii toxin family protein [Deltaproteobacteria bacterium]